MTRQHFHVDRGVVLWREGAGSWYLDICQDGARTRRSLRTRNKDHAIQIAKEHAAQVHSGRWNVRLAAGMLLSTAIKQFSEEYESIHHAPSTRAYTRMVFIRLVAFMQHRNPGREPHIDAIRTDDMLAFQRELADRNTCDGTKVSASTVNRHLREVATLMSWAVRKGAVRINPCDEVRALRGIKRIRQPLTRDEIERLHSHLSDRLADLVTVILAAGLRLGEATHLRSEDVDGAGARVVVRSRTDYAIKDREEREVPVEDPAGRAVLARRRLAAAGGLLFANSQGHVPDGRDLLRALHRAAREAGIRRVDFYLLRHTYATEMAKLLMPYELAARMGHSDVRTANRFYVHLGRPAVERRADAV